MHTRRVSGSWRRAASITSTSTSGSVVVIRTNRSRKGGVTSRPSMRGFQATMRPVPLALTRIVFMAGNVGCGWLFLHFGHGDGEWKALMSWRMSYERLPSSRFVRPCLGVASVVTGRCSAKFWLLRRHTLYRRPSHRASGLRVVSVAHQMASPLADQTNPCRPRRECP